MKTADFKDIVGQERFLKDGRGLVIQPGAIGDCILTLELAAFIKDYCSLGGVDMLGHSDYTGILPGRTCVDSAPAFDSIELHRLYVDENDFYPQDGDPLVRFFGQYKWIATFLGEPGSNFEKNLIFTTACSRSAEVVTMALRPPRSFRGHITDFYTRQFIRLSGLHRGFRRKQPAVTIKATAGDRARGAALIKQAIGAWPGPPVVMHPGSGGASKCWHLENFTALAGKLAAMGIPALFLVGPAEIAGFDAGQMRRLRCAAPCLENPPLGDAVSILSAARAFTGNDSGITHLAAAMGLKTVAIFGPTRASLYGPRGPDVTIVSDRTAGFAVRPSKQRQEMCIQALVRGGEADL